MAALPCAKCESAARGDRLTQGDREYGEVSGLCPRDRIAGFDALDVQREPEPLRPLGQEVGVRDRDHRRVRRLLRESHDQIRSDPGGLAGRDRDHSCASSSSRIST
jgi:hypothetical protein